MAERLAALTLEHGTSTFILGEATSPTSCSASPRKSSPPSATWSTRERPVLSVVEERRSERWLRRDEVPSRDEPRNQPDRPSHPHADDGTRLSAALPWDETTRPTYAGPDDAPYQQPGVPQHLLDIHDHLRSELARCATWSTRYAAAR